MSEEKETFETGNPKDSGDTDLPKQLIRENAEPVEENHPLPYLFMIIISALFAWAGWYMSEYKGDFSWSIYDETQGSGSAIAAGPVVFDPMKAGEKFFKKNCVICHQSTGLGIPGSFPPLVGSDWVQSDPERLVKILLHGMQGEITVNGDSYNGVMPAFATEKDKDIAAVLTWIRTNAEWANGSDAVTEEFVKEIREKTKDQTAAWDGALLQP